MSGATAPTYPDWWVAAQAECLKGHGEGCTYGGLTPSGGYWLSVEGCTEPHGDTCAACGADVEAGFSGWGPGGTVWAVLTCGAHAEEILAADPTTWRRPGGEM